MARHNMSNNNANCKGEMASDLCLGIRPGAATTESDHSTSNNNNSSSNCNDVVELSAMAISNNIREVNENISMVSGLEGYVRALQAEREKLDAFRRELPICMDLLDHAIQDSRMKLARVLAQAQAEAGSSSRPSHVASIASELYSSSNHFNNNNNSNNHEDRKNVDNNNNTPSTSTYNANFSNTQQLLAGISVQRKASSEDEENIAAGVPAGEIAYRAAQQLHMWSAAATCSTKPTHADHDAYNYNTRPQHDLQQQPQYDHQLNPDGLSHINHQLHDHPSATLQLNSSHIYPHLQQHFTSAPAPHLQLIPSHDHPSAFLDRSSYQKEVPSTSGHSYPQIENSTKIHAFTPLNFSSSTNHLENIHGLMTRGSHSFEGLMVDNMQEEDRSSPTMMGSTSQYNTSPSGGMNSQTPRKARRCWSPELHQRFLHALQQLGGPQLATPKQIREVMHVEGLTNDEVKSHLQKFRLHTRRPTTMQVGEPTPQPHHVVVFGGIWMPTSPVDSTPIAGGGGHLANNTLATSSPSHNSFMQLQHVIGQHPMHALLSATTSEKINIHAVGMESASEVDVARSDQSSQNGETGGVDNNSIMNEEEDTEIHLGAKRPISKDITSPIEKSRYQ